MFNVTAQDNRHCNIVLYRFRSVDIPTFRQLILEFSVTDIFKSEGIFSSDNHLLCDVDRAKLTDCFVHDCCISRSENLIQFVLIS